MYNLYLRSSIDRSHHQKKYSAEDNFQFQTHRAGRLNLCFEWRGQGVKSLQLEMDLVAAADVNYRSASASSSSYLQQAQELLPMVDRVEAETLYLTGRQNRFEQTMSNTHGRVLFFVFVNFAVMVAAGAWQVLHLRAFFKQKKLV